MDFIDQVTLNEQEVLASPVPWQTSHEQTARALAKAINLHPGYYARAKGDVVTITRPNLWQRLLKWVYRCRKSMTLMRLIAFVRRAKMIGFRITVFLLRALIVATFVLLS